MSTTNRSDLVLPSVLAEDILKGFSGKLTMRESGAMVVMMGLDAGAQHVGNTVTVPYYEDGGEAQEVAENAAGSLEKVTQSSETATVVRMFKGFSVTSLAQAAKASGKDPYDVARDMIQTAFARKVDSYGIARAIARATSASMEYDGTAANISTTAIVETLKLFGEELDDAQLAMWAMNAKPYWDAAQLADSTGRALYTDVQGGRLSQLGGAPVRMTAKSDLVIAGSPTTYKSLLCKKNAVVCYMNENVKIDIVRDPTADTDMIIANAYAVVHAYSVMPGGTKAGVAVCKTR
jgi:HK97 family phage major capsid protein